MNYLLDYSEKYRTQLRRDSLFKALVHVGLSS
jgi:hypothetical protein